MDSDGLALNVMRRVNLADILLRAAARHPERAALVEPGRVLSYRALDQWVNRLAEGLLAAGFARGDALALMMGNSGEFLALFLACARTGVVCVPINLSWGPTETRHVLHHAKVKGAVVDAVLMGAFAEAAGPLLVDLAVYVFGDVPGVQSLAELERGDGTSPVLCEVGKDDAVSYLYTSGTTSAPKGVINTHLACYVAALGGVIDMALVPADRMAALMPMFHTAQLYALCMPAIAAGATIYPLRGFNAASLLDLIERERLSVIFGLPMMYRELLAEQTARPRDVSCLRLGVYAMAPIGSQELARLRQVFGFGMALLFGQTEMNPITAILKPDLHDSHGGAMGTPSVNVQIAIQDDEGRTLPPGERGEIVYRGPQVFAGYLHDPASTAAACRNGWFRSGDAGYFDEDGVLWFTDRFKDIIKSGGENVSSLEVETAIYTAAPGLGEVAVVGLPHPHWIEAITAFIALAPGTVFDEAALMAALRETLSTFKRPKALIVVEALPKTATGKVQKHLLRAQFAAHYAEDGAA